MRTSTYLLIFVLALIGWKQSLGLTCYYCAPDDTFLTGAPTCDKAQIQECYPNVTMCIKARPSKSFGLTPGLYKLCHMNGFGVSDELAGCEQRKEGMICGCHSDLCNSANRSIFLLTASGLLLLLLNIFAFEINVY
ncbi:hypothetical protein M3Y94_00905700 [Aphelenchoides besseyi]|nr:hypothetical protein M3Y94_00905700 [Aphelenchoides besseyi]